MSGPVANVDDEEKSAPPSVEDSDYPWSYLLSGRGNRLLLWQMERMFENQLK